MPARKLEITFADGHTASVQPTLEDRLKFEQTLRKNKGWGPLADNALKLEPFMAWSAARRAGITELTWEEFTTGATAALDVQAERDDAGDSSLEVEGLGEGTPTEESNTSPSSSD
ncbi:hypothetical protein [Microbacterium dauci]|uniref:Tail assembly chaperone n=1 Tax=Microbacterium dauci TaxID=3048008 RepID=A0ABT6ZGQ9_9MICO|nr:hypothetical protein [Microbacterium sp. LX3-4]MDJ1115346.1 hypothetical protein [Microbacterium sp. LX3-4]